MVSKYIVQRNGKSFGPFDQATLHKKAADGVLRPTDSIRHVEGSEWKQCSEIPGLFPQASREGGSGKLPGIQGERPETGQLGTDVSDVSSKTGEAFSGSYEAGQVGSAGVLSMCAGYLCIFLGLADILLNNLGVLNIYAGIPFIAANRVLNVSTGAVAMGVGGILVRVSSRSEPIFKVLSPVLLAGAIGIMGVASVSVGVIFFSGTSNDVALVAYNTHSDDYNEFIEIYNAVIEASNTKVIAVEGAGQMLEELSDSDSANAVADVFGSLRVALQRTNLARIPQAEAALRQLLDGYVDLEAAARVDDVDAFNAGVEKCGRLMSGYESALAGVVIQASETYLRKTDRLGGEDENVNDLFRGMRGAVSELKDTFVEHGVGAVGGEAEALISQLDVLQDQLKDKMLERGYQIVFER